MEKEIKKEKLGFVLTNTNFGMQEAFAVNKDSSWAIYISDVRDAIKPLTDFDKTGKIVYLLRFLGKEGCLLTLIRARSYDDGRPHDNSAAWIHIPVNADISNKEMETVLKEVTSAILCELDTDKNIIKRTFEKSYPTKGVAYTILESIVSNKESGYAVRYFGKNTSYTISELLGNTIAQEEYSRYKGVFFIDKESGVTLNGGTEITSNCKEIYTYQPLKPIDGFTPYLDGKPLNQQIEVSEGSKHTIVWKRRGYADIEKSITIKSNSSEDCPQWPASAQIMPNDYKVIIHRGMFVIKNENEKLLSDARVFVDNHLLENEILVSEARYKEGLEIKIKASEYDDYNQKVKGLMEKEHNVVLKKHEYTYLFKISAYNGEKEQDAIVTLKTHCELKGSPIEGYYCNGAINENEPKKLNRNSYKSLKIKYALLGFVTCLLCVLIWIGCSYVWNNYHLDRGFPWIYKNEKQSKNGSGSTYNDYLLNHDTLNKNTLDMYDPIRGMFDELNAYDCKKLKARIEQNPKLSKVQFLYEVLELMSSVDSLSGTYCSDDVIIKKEYIDKLKSKQSQNNRDEENNEADNDKSKQKKSN